LLAVAKRRKEELSRVERLQEKKKDQFLPPSLPPLSLLVRRRSGYTKLTETHHITSLYLA
jgi:hypothetical protein